MRIRTEFMLACVVHILVVLGGTIPATGLAAERRVPELPSAGERIRVVIDTDAACEVDDHYALALALLSPERFDIEGIVAAHYGDSGGPQGLDKSLRDIHTVLDKAGMAGRFPVRKGSPPFQYSQVPIDSEGVQFIIERAMDPQKKEPLWIISLGACTNVAAAYRKEPRIKDRVVVFWHGRTRWPDKAWNFNAYNDLKAVRILFASPLPMVLFDTGAHLTLPMPESEKMIRPFGPLGEHLHAIRLRSPAWQRPSKGMYDLGDIAALVDPSIIKMEVVKAPSVTWDMLYDHKTTHGQILRIFDIDREATLALLRGKLAEAAR